MINIKYLYISAYMKKMYKRTTIWLPVDIHTQAKMMALLTETSFSKLLRIALVEKMKQLKEKHAANIPKRNMETHKIRKGHYG